MNFFDTLIGEAADILAPFPKKSFPAGEKWEDAGRSELILLREAACELSGTGFNLVTASDIGGDGDRITVVGEELSDIAGERPFARLSVIQTEPLPEGQPEYDHIKNLEYTKYHCFPRGYMIRASTRGYRETVRVSKSAVKEGISFRKVGSLLAEKLRAAGGVKKIHIFYITTPRADYKRLESLARRTREITETLNRVVNDADFDCSSCALKPICDEVEGMRELHFRTTAER